MKQLYAYASLHPRRLLFCSAVCLLLVAIAAAEVPELLCLTDQVSNDFTVRKASERGVATTLSAVIQRSAILDTENFEYKGCARNARIFRGTEIVFSDLFVLLSVFRK